MSRELKIGVVGYCPPSKFNEAMATEMICEAYDRITVEYPDRAFVCVSGLCDVGVLAIAYAEAKRRGWRTVGFTSSVAKSCGHPLFPVDEELIVGEKWGEESDAFVAYIDCLVRIGMGAQSLREAGACRAAGKATHEYDLPRLPDRSEF